MRSKIYSQLLTWKLGTYNIYTMKNDVPFYFQSASHDCVPACVMALGDHYHSKIDLNEIRSLLVTDPAKGTVIKNLTNLSPYFKVTLGRIVDHREIPNYTPFIAYLNQQHAVVVWGFSDAKRQSCLVGDPSVGVVTMTTEELAQIWDGIVAVLRPWQEIPAVALPRKRRDWEKAVHLDKVRKLRVSWWLMGWESLIIAIVGGLNTAYALYYVQFLPQFSHFILFMVSYGLISLLLTFVDSVVRMRITLHYERLLGMRLEEAMRHINVGFYTLGDMSTRYQDVIAVIGAIMGLFRDIPYSLVLFGGSLYFLARINWMLSVFTVSFLVLLVVFLLPFVRRIQQMVYKIRIKQGELSNKIMAWLSGRDNEVNTLWNELIGLQYKQAIRSIPISAIISNSVVLSILFVVIFLNWKEGSGYAANTAGYQKLLTAIMIMNYAVSAGHNLYGRIVGWQMAIPSLHRLTDFLSVDRKSGAVSVSSLEVAAGEGHPV